MKQTRSLYAVLPPLIKDPSVSTNLYKFFTDVAGYSELVKFITQTRIGCSQVVFAWHFTPKHKLFIKLAYFRLLYDLVF